jgi:ParB-like chromosome segregation protein Spo0J
MAGPRTRHNTTENLQAVRLDQVHVLPEMQVRDKLDRDSLQGYERLFREVGEDKCQCPPITVYIQGEGDRTRYVLADGHHRVTAARRAGRTSLNAYIREGTLDAAFEYAVTYNLRHGLQYSRADKQRIVEWYLDHPTYGKLSAREIANRMGNMIPHTTVQNARNRRKSKDGEEAFNLNTGSGQARERTRTEITRARVRRLDRIWDDLALVRRDDADAGVLELTDRYLAAILDAFERYKEAIDRLEQSDAEETDDTD